MYIYTYLGSVLKFQILSYIYKYYHIILHIPLVSGVPVSTPAANGVERLISCEGQHPRDLRGNTRPRQVLIQTAEKSG